jgi:hypothetical protein
LTYKPKKTMKRILSRILLSLRRPPPRVKVRHRDGDQVSWLGDGCQGLYLSRNPSHAISVTYASNYGALGHMEHPRSILMGKCQEWGIGNLEIVNPSTERVIETVGPGLLYHLLALTPNFRASIRW